MSADVISKHDGHRVKGVDPRIKAPKRDAAILIKNRILDAVEKGDQSENGLDILDKDLQSALSTALKAQAIEDKRETKKVTQNFWVELGAGLFQERHLLPEGDVIEGVAHEVTDE